MSLAERTRLQRWTFLVLFVLAAYAFWRTLEPIWVPVLLGLVIAVGVHPIHERLLRRLGGSHRGRPRAPWTGGWWCSALPFRRFPWSLSAPPLPGLPRPLPPA